jgi:hypothetical protein
MLRHRDEAYIRQAVERRKLEARGPDAVESRFLGKSCGKRRMRRHDVKEVGAGHAVTQALSRHQMMSWCPDSDIRITLRRPLALV